MCPISGRARAARGCIPSSATSSARSMGVPGARAFRRHLAENASGRARTQRLRDALALVEDRVTAEIAA